MKWEAGKKMHNEVLSNLYYLNDQVENEMGGAYNTNGEEERI
jgi:hypothetical protein